MKMRKQRNGICFVVAFVLLFFSCTTSALMRSFIRQEYSPHAPRKRHKTHANIKQNHAKLKRKNTHTQKKGRQSRKATCSCILLAFALKYYLGSLYLWLACRTQFWSSPMKGRESMSTESGPVLHPHHSVLGALLLVARMDACALWPPVTSPKQSLQGFD